MEALIAGLVILVLVFLFLGAGTWVFAGLLMDLTGQPFVDNYDAATIQDAGTYNGKIYEINLTDEEKALLQKSADAVQELVDVLKPKLDSL